MNNTPFFLLLTISHLSIDGCLGNDYERDRKACQENADKSDDWLLTHKKKKLSLPRLYLVRRNHETSQSCDNRN